MRAITIAFRSSTSRFLFLVALLCGVPFAFAANVDRPNVLVLLADDIGAKELACYGHPTHQTPKLDQLAADGTMFETCWATPLCSPTRVLLMTGRYGFRTGWLDLIGRAYAPKPTDKFFDLGGEQVTFADLAKSRGYVTALAGKWQLPGEGDSLVHDCGFDHYMIWAYKHNLPPGVVHTGGWENVANQKTARYWHPCLLRDNKYVPTSADDYGPDLETDFVIDFIRENKDKPWLVYCPMCSIHPPLEPTPDPTDPGKKWPRGLASNVAYLDHLVGRMVDAIDELGLADRTYIVFVGDNGTAGDGKGKVTELGARVPLIIRGPTVKKGVDSRELTDISDIFPTIAEWIGAKLPTDRELDGKSLAPTLAGESGPHRDWIFSYLKDERLIRDNRWLIEGDGRMFDCGDSRIPGTYRDVTDSKDPEVIQARERLEKVLSGLPAPEKRLDLEKLKPAKPRRAKKTSPDSDST